MSSREKKWSLKASLSPGSTPNPSLPYDLVLSCLARVPRLYYPNLSLVSKSFRSILASPELYKTRTLLGRTETFLYVCLRFPEEANPPRWFTLYRKPKHTTKKTKKKKKIDSSCNLLAPVPILNSPPLELSSFIAVDCNIYAIEDYPCSNVWFLDCRTHTWLEAPKLRLAHTNSEYDGYMYLAGSSEKPESLHCVEVFNTKTQTWKHVKPEKPIFKLGNLEGKMWTNFGVESSMERMVIKPKDLTCEMAGVKLDKSSGISVCMVENITYFLGFGNFLWKKLNETFWRRLEGLEGLLPRFGSDTNVKIADYDGKLVVLWDKYVPASGHKEKMIWCAKISLEKRNNDEIWGKVEWFDAVLTVPKSVKFVCAVTATL